MRFEYDSEHPCHLVEAWDSRKAFCGARDPRPAVTQRYATRPLHLPLCADCYTIAGLDEMLVPTVLPQDGPRA